MWVRVTVGPFSIHAIKYATGLGWKWRASLFGQGAGTFGSREEAEKGIKKVLRDWIEEAHASLQSETDTEQVSEAVEEMGSGIQMNLL